MEIERLIVFAKRPILGRVKSRLAKDIGESKALELYIQLLNHTAKVVEEWQIRNDSRNVYWFWDSAKEDFKIKIEHSVGESEKDYYLPSNFEIYIQREGDLGEKMTYAFEEIFMSAGYTGKTLSKPYPIAIIGTDCPGLNWEILEDCFTKLQAKDIVIGPAEDGGYYLLGMRGFFPEVFKDVDWSTERVFEQSLRNIGEIKLSWDTLVKLNDIDRLEDLAR